MPHQVRHSLNISIHALLAESDGRLPINDSITLQFLSTLSLRRATAWLDYSEELFQISIHALLAESDPVWELAYTSQQNFYPRSPCGERLNGAGSWICLLHFYPRSPCGERL